MEITEKSIVEFTVDRTWAIVVEKGTDVYKYHLLNKVAETSKVIDKTEPIEDIDTIVEQMIPKLKDFKEDIIFDTKLVPKHLVNKGSELWKDCKREAEFIANVTYLVLGIMVKAYNEIYEANAFPLEDGDVAIDIMKGVHRVGETLMSVEHRGGMVNAVANDRVERLN